MKASLSDVVINCLLYYGFHTLSHLWVLGTDKGLISCAAVWLYAVAREESGEGSATGQVVDQEVHTAVDGKEEVGELEDAGDQLE